MFRHSRIFYALFLDFYCDSNPQLSSRDIKLSLDVIEISFDIIKLSLDLIGIRPNLDLNGLHSLKTPSDTASKLTNALFLTIKI